MSNVPVMSEPFTMTQRIRYGVWCLGLSSLLLLTSMRPWVRDARSGTATLSLWDLPGSENAALGDSGLSVLGMLLVTLVLAVLTGLRPVRPLVLGTMLSAVLSFIDTMGLHQALADTPGRPGGLPACFTSAPGVAAAGAETLTLIVGLGLLALAGTASHSARLGSS
ncbi:hypothetical protein Skr01_26270 [Sphaerisporangium krabiense]|uniref:Uncharacterized protein n=1 Tax=Sphaerisporangium krabiense TaxID=763782 RepID=A0A7W9DTW9_9ACTN|nr:hypothetical protein [Sphaerisporangium krabiense]MBB5630504.1 hypothetical protein [Sphaerisporangium krabiense]GII62542.1 hypothetical protein Skr01_26270 [Sphaerisporangium krabiense]